MLRRTGALLLMTAWTACASLDMPNQPIDLIDPSLGYRPGPDASHRGSDDVWFLLTFSGGGTRAAAFAYGVLEVLRDTEITIDGRKTRLLDEVDTVSGVSGGSFPAAYYGLYGDRIFQDFEERFIRRNVEGALIVRALYPWNAVRLMTPALSRTHLASDFYARNVFDHATFAELEAAGGAQVFVNATDLTDGNRFTFTQTGFDVICSDLAAFPISAAVAASSAVPGLLSPLTLRNYAGRCGFEEPTWFKEALEVRDSDPRRYRAARTALPYLEPDVKRFIHLVDGGIADNLGARVALDRISAVGGIERFRETEKWEPPKHLIVIVVNAETAPDPTIDLRVAAPGLVATMSLVSGAQINRENFDTLDLLSEAVERWANELTTPDHRVMGHVVEVSFDHIRDPDERQYLKHLPTSFSLSDEQVDRLEAASHTLLGQSSQFQKLLEDLQD